MPDVVREMTLKEEIEALSIEESTKQRLLSKLKEYDYITEEHKALLAKTREEMYSKILPLEEANAALMTACNGLARAMVAQRRIYHADV